MSSDSFDGSSADWAHYLIFNHGDGSSYYHYVLRFPFWGLPQYQRQTGNTTSKSGWKGFITDENIGSQSVTHASTADKAANALTLLNGTKKLIFAGCFTLSYQNGVVTFTAPSDGTYSCIRSAAGIYSLFLPPVYSEYTNVYILYEYVFDSSKGIIPCLDLQWNNTNNCGMGLYISDNNNDHFAEPNGALPLKFGIMFAKN